MALDFPNTPTPGQIYTLGGISYTYNGYAWVVGGGSQPITTVDYVLRAGDSMTGLLTLSADPTAPLHAATRQYVDAVGLPTGGNPGEAMVKDPTNIPLWGAPIDGGNY